ncbi:acyl-CoA C20 Delta5-desaturase-like [Papaver somniferum]|uniref:acyl-CoA C20 Delta5-desaturase-like n=1 Tax=Papaver somniferum TaxID=3469 RepID=UPI000E70384A|nr:acyl-CoA C20 Delta5-desaturase-like [Papaver somniferum]
MAVEPVFTPKGELWNIYICLLVAPYYFTWNAFWGFWASFFWTNCIGISLSYHRNLSHKSFKLPKSLEYLFAYFGLHAAQGDPIFWVSIHRYHHQFTDSDRDPHSPIEGFWFSHMTWIFQHSRLREKCGKRNNVMDLQNQAYYRFIYLLGFRIALETHLSFAVNSVCHTWGKRPWNTKDLSKNNWVVNILGHGEGWHNNHHAFEFSACLELEWWQLDMPWYVIKLLEHFGLATDVKVPTEIQKLKMSYVTPNEFHQREKDC